MPDAFCRMFQGMVGTFIEAHAAFKKKIRKQIQDHVQKLR